MTLFFCPWIASLVQVFCALEHFVYVSFVVQHNTTSISILFIKRSFTWIPFAFTEVCGGHVKKYISFANKLSFFNTFCHNYLPKVLYPVKTAIIGCKINMITMATCRQAYRYRKPSTNYIKQMKINISNRANLDTT